MSNLFASEWPTDGLSAAQRSPTPEDSGPILAMSDGYAAAQARYRNAISEIFGDATEEEPDASERAAETLSSQNTNSNGANTSARDRKATEQMKQRIIHENVRRFVQKKP